MAMPSASEIPGQEPPAQPRAAPRSVRWLAGWLAVLLVCAALLAGRIRPAQIARALGTVDLPLVVAAALLVLLADVLAGSEKYRSLLALLGGRMSLGETIVLRMGSFPVRYLMPLKSGEMVRIAYLRRRHGVPPVRGALLALADSAAEASAILAFWALGLAVEIRRGAAFALAGAAAVALLWRYREALLRSPRLPLAGARSEWLRQMQDAPRSGRARKLIRALLCGALYVGVVLVAHWMVFRALGLSLPASVILSAVPPMLLVAGLHLTPLGLGTREGAAVVLLARYGRPEQLLTAALLLAFVLHGAPLLAGIFVMKPLSDRLLAATAEEGAPGRGKDPAG